MTRATNKVALVFYLLLLETSIPYRLLPLNLSHMQSLHARKANKIFVFFAVVLLLLSSAVYTPGISGPYLFDDPPNLLDNHYVKIHELTVDTLREAAFSLEAGPLRRPISMVSFAVNHYFAGGFDDSTPFKATNIAIHAINGLLLFWFLKLFFHRLAVVRQDQWAWLNRGRISNTILLAAGVAWLWLLAPIQLTSVLYVVQRMVSLSAMFTLLALICYMHGRLGMLTDKRGAGWLLGLGVPISGVLALYSKENAALLPLYLLLLEIILFGGEYPWRHWQQLTKNSRLVLLGFLLLVTCALLVWSVYHFAPSYSGRHFTLEQRLLTEARVLWLYLYLTLVPMLNQLGLNHDDIVVSTSLLTPWTTLPSVMGLLGLMLLVAVSFKKHPLLALGISWFLVGHSLESTFIPLEIAHEHRNYLPSLGPLLVVTDILNKAAKYDSRSKSWLLLPVFAVIFGIITFMRSTQWSDDYTFARYEVFHHPDSAHANTYLGWNEARHGLYRDALKSMRRAAKLDPLEAVYYINMHLIAARSDVRLDAHDQAETLTRLTQRPLSPSSLNALNQINACLDKHCIKMAAPLEQWMRTILPIARKNNSDRSFYLYLLGRSLYFQGKADEALTMLRAASKEDPGYLHPAFEIAKIYLNYRKIPEAKAALQELRRLNEAARYRRDNEIEELSRRITALTDGPQTIDAAGHKN